MEAKIENLEQLRAQITSLKIKKAEQEIYLNQTVSKVSKAFVSPINFIKGALSFLGLRSDKTVKNSKEADWATSLARIAFPLFLNKTILSGRGIIFKTIVSLLSQNAINPANFNKNVFAHWIDKASDWVNQSLNHRKNLKKEDDYGLPPESETYSGKPIH